MNINKFIENWDPTLPTQLQERRIPHSSVKADPKTGLLYLLNKLADSTLITRVNEWSYVLATVYHETDFTFAPVNEWLDAPWNKGKVFAYAKPHSLTGKVYFGRGYVQLTWYENYLKFSRLLNIDLINKPELACEPEAAWKILELGMSDGLFTGLKLANYFDGTKSDYIGARKIINGVDQKELIAEYAVKIQGIFDRIAEPRYGTV